MTDGLDGEVSRCDGVRGQPHRSADADHLGFVALSLLPIHTWRDIGERLRAGDAPAVALDRLVTARWPLEPHRSSALLAAAAAALARGAERGLTPIVWSDAAYPPALTAIIDPPPVLWTRGSRAALERPAVAIVGSRAASPYALEVAEQLAADLAARGLAIVSGLARGVDSAAHRGALSAGGSTIAVLGCGADIVYPKEHAALARAIEPDGLIISELVPGTRPLPQFFRSATGSSAGCHAPSSSSRRGSGADRSSRRGARSSRGATCWRCPGNVLSGRNRGGHALLRDGAKIVECADDILEELNGVVGRVPSAARITVPCVDPVLACLPPGEACDLDGISERSGLSPARLLPRLFELELQGLIRRAGGGRFVRFDRTC